MNKIKFAQRSSVEFVEEGNILAPKFNSEEIIPVVVTETKSGLVLMLGYMNKEALVLYLEDWDMSSFLPKKHTTGAEAEKLCGKKVSLVEWSIK